MAKQPDRSERRSRGRRRVNRLFEIRAVEWVGLVEQRQDVQRPVMHEALDRELTPFDEPLDEHCVMRIVALGADVGCTQHRAKPIERRKKRRPIVGPDDALGPRPKPAEPRAGLGDGDGPAVALAVDQFDGQHLAEHVGPRRLRGAVDNVFEYGTTSIGAEPTDS